MPDIPFDTLFIVGLLIASFVGKVLEGRAKKRKPKTSQTSQSTEQLDEEDYEEKTLDDLLKKVTGAGSEPKERQSFEITEDTYHDDDLNRDSILPLNILPEPALSKTYLQSFKHSESSSSQSSRNLLLEEALKSDKSLRQAFILKEILDQPISLRHPHF